MAGRGSIGFAGVTLAAAAVGATTTHWPLSHATSISIEE